MNRKGELVPTSKKFVLGLNGSYIATNGIAKFSSAGETFGGLSREYGVRQEIIDEIKQERDSQDKGSGEWFRQHTRYVSANKRLHAWLSNTCYTKAAEKLGKAIKKEEKVIVKQAQEYRLATAIESIRGVDTPEDLVESSGVISNGLVKFGVVESQHCRLIFPTSDVDEDQAKGLLELAETAIDGFKIEYVDPYVDGISFKDNIPDGQFIEWFFTPVEDPEDTTMYAAYYEEYYKLNWGKDRERVLKTGGTRTRLAAPHRKLNYRRLQENNDLEGTITHHVGHCLASFHYNGGGEFQQMAWLPEAVAYHVSFEMLGRNSVTCVAFHEEQARKYREAPRDDEDIHEGEKTMMRGTRDVFNSMALAEGPKIEVLALKRLVELNDADLAKSWSLYDYIVRKKGLVGQQWLRAGAKVSANRGKMINEWRESSDALFEVEGKDVFKMINDSWRHFAETGQDTSGGEEG